MGDSLARVMHFTFYRLMRRYFGINDWQGCFTQWACVMLLAGLLAFNAGAAPIALNANDKLSLVVEANEGRFDDLKQEYSLKGKVQITRGTVRFEGDQVTLKQDAKGFRNLQIVSNPNQRAYFRNARTAENVVEGYAEVVKYDSTTEDIQLQGKATLRHTQNGKTTEEVSGPLIKFNTITEIFQLQKGTTNSGRVRILIQPKN